MTYRIWLDQDDTIYRMSDVWFDMHNADYPEHHLDDSHIHEYDASNVCIKAGCNGNLYDYFNKPKLWSSGEVIGSSDVITRRWIKELSVEIGVLTTVVSHLSPSPKMLWLEKHFPHIDDLIMVNGPMKHLLRGDILVDDGLHNLSKWQGIGILYGDFVRNHAAHTLKAKNWNEVDYLVRKSIKLLDMGHSHKTVQGMLHAEQMVGI